MATEIRLPDLGEGIVDVTVSPLARGGGRSRQEPAT